MQRWTCNRVRTHVAHQRNMWTKDNARDYGVSMQGVSETANLWAQVTQGALYLAERYHFVFYIVRAPANDGV